MNNLRTRTPEQVLVDEIIATGEHIHGPAELVILALMLHSKDFRHEAASGLIETDGGPQAIHEGFFYNKRNLLCYIAMCQLVNEGSPLFPPAITSRARQLGFQRGWTEPEDTVTPTFLHDLKNGSHTDYTLDEAVKLLSRGDAARRLIAVGTLAARIKPDQDPFALSVEVRDKLDRIVPGRDSNLTLFGEEASRRFQLDLEERRRMFKAGVIVPKMGFPWPSWKRFFREPPVGKYMTVLMPQSHGKSIYSHSLAEYWAWRGYNVLLFMLEDSQTKFYQRQVCRWAGIDMDTLMDANYTDEEEKRVTAARGRTATFDHSLHPIEAAGFSVQEALVTLGMMNDKRKVDICILDYYNVFVQSVRRGGDVDYFKGPVSIVAASNSFKIPFVIFNQFTKSGEKAAKGGKIDAGDEYGGIPLQHSASIRMAGSSPILESSKLVGGEFYQEGEMSPIVEWIIFKNNDGRIGKFENTLRRKNFHVLREDEQPAQQSSGLSGDVPGDRSSDDFDPPE